LPVPPVGYVGVAFDSTSDLNWKNVNYCTMKTVNIGSNINGEKSSLKRLILSHITIFGKICPLLCDFWAPKWPKIAKKLTILTPSISMHCY